MTLLFGEREHITGLFRSIFPCDVFQPSPPVCILWGILGSGYHGQLFVVTVNYSDILKE